MILKLEKQNNYELLDSGNGEKLEKFGNFILSRPDPQAIWDKTKNLSLWEKAELIFERKDKKIKWFIKNGVPKDWVISFGNLNFLIKPTSFKHIGLFPEQLNNWLWFEKIIKTSNKSRNISVLNLFAYTGGATLICAKAGAEVCHVDASKNAVIWAKENATLSNLDNKPIRWIIDDVILFLKRELKRGRKYDAIIMDPPSFGHGPKDELWKIEDDFLNLINLSKELLSDDPLFVLINGYTSGYSSIAYENIIKNMMSKYVGEIESGELVLKQDNGILLPAGIFARWTKKYDK